MQNRILSIGEVLWDLLPSGPVMGGAAANFAVHCQALGATSGLVSRVGDDPRGHEILRLLRQRKIDTRFVGVDRELPTGVVTVALADDGQPHYDIHENVAWDAISLSPECLSAAGGADAVCFGTLAQRAPASRSAIETLVGALPPESLRVFDINLRQQFYSREIVESSLMLANVLKLNEIELPVLAEMFRLSGDAESQIASLADRFHLRAVAYTRGANGSVLLVDGERSRQDGLSVTVRDTVGAGDAFTAAMVVGLVAEWPLAAIHERAGEVAAFVCSHSGPTPVLPESFQVPPTQIPTQSAL